MKWASLSFPLLNFVVWCLLPGKPASIPFPSLSRLFFVRHSCEQQHPPPSLSFGVTFPACCPDCLSLQILPSQVLTPFIWFISFSNFITIYHHSSGYWLTFLHVSLSHPTRYKLYDGKDTPPLLTPQKYPTLTPRT